MEKIRFDLRKREVERRDVRDGVSLLFQHRTIIHNTDGTKVVGEWMTTSSIPNYGEVYDKKPSLIRRAINWITGSQSIKPLNIDKTK